MLKKGNILDIGFKAVRESGKVNMFGKNNVQYYAFKMGFFELVTWLQEANSAEYMTYLNAINWGVVPDADWRYLLDLNDEYEARQFLFEDFEDEILEYKKNYKELTLAQSPFTFNDFATSPKKNTYQYYDENTDSHFLNYVLPFAEGTTVYWFKDGFYKESKGEYSTLTGEDWARAVRNTTYEELSQESKAKYDVIHQRMRLALLMTE